MIFLGAQTVTLHSRTTSSTDAYGQEVYTETTQTLSRVAMQPNGSSETLGEADMVTDHWVLTAPVSVALAAVDRVTYNGWTFEADGDPEQWSDFMGFPHHQTLRLRRVTG